ncbi:MAG: excinuclease ABC subunit UvrC [Thermotogae bacterium]|nr:excinuclease ABC subunit UvrC [Thermotogota bacterium]
MSETLQEKIRNAPDAPGVYIFKSDDTIVYIGKANSLRKRLLSYIRSSTWSRYYKAQLIMQEATDVDYILVENEHDALMLEANLIRQYKPKYNVMLKDSQFYPYILVTEEEIPRIAVVRDRTLKGHYFGPYSSVRFARDIVELVTKLFKIRTCSRSMKRITKPCFEYHLKRCSAPCSQLVSREEYIENVEKLLNFLNGDIEATRKELQKLMTHFANALAFESAARVRNILNKLDRVFPEEGVVFQERKDMDVICYTDELVLLMRVVGGRLLSKLTFEVSGMTSMDELLEEIYERKELDLPEVVLVKDLSSLDGEMIERFNVHIPQTEGERRLIMLCEKNLEQEMKHFNANMEILRNLKMMLGLKRLPETVEGIDVSHTFGREAYASVVRFENARPFKEKYRLYRIREHPGDDMGSIREILKRRYSKHPTPDLIFIDGGQPQVQVAKKTLDEMGKDVDIIGLAKKSETIVTPSTRVELPHSHPVLRFLVNIRDEAHRFAIKTHRRMRDKRELISMLDGIEGIGEKRKKMLLKRLGGVEGIIEASVEEIAEILGSHKLAVKIKEVLGGIR